MVERQLGNLARAEALSMSALVFACRTRDEMATPWTLNGLAAVSAAQGRLERAAILHGMAESLLARAGGEWPADERARFEQTDATLGAGLSAEARDAARARGAALSLVQACAFALGRGEE